MFDTIILLTGAAEQAPLASLLRRHNPQLTIRGVESLAEIVALEPGLLARARLIGFLTPVVVPVRILDALGFGAYNFHPGSPRYPGWLPAHFAIYDRATDFGVTAHIMVEQVDAGPIVGAELFRIPPNSSVRSLEELAYVRVAHLFWNLSQALANNCQPPTELSVRWGDRRSTRRRYAAMCDIPTDISKDELDRRIDAFGIELEGLGPTITLHGRQFRYVEADANLKIDAPGIVPELLSAMRRTG
jgi:methionyl-tRNA formyltransferase